MDVWNELLYASVPCFVTLWLALIVFHFECSLQDTSKRHYSMVIQFQSFIYTYAFNFWDMQIDGEVLKQALEN